MSTNHAARVRLVCAALVAATAVGVALLAPRGLAPAHAAQPGAKGEPGEKKKDPLQPAGPDDVATGFAACRACHAEKPPIDVKGNAFAKKYKSHEFVLLSEGRTWTGEDPHSAAHRVLEGALGKQMSGILKYDVTKAAQCLTCHAIDRNPGAPLPKAGADAGDRFETSEGVTCNACHGLRKPWQQEHFNEKGGTIPWRTFTPEKKESHGMRNLRDPVVKAQLCATCHVGDPGLNRVVTHDMYAAGHPPLPPFEIGTFMEGEPKHWGYPTDERLKFFTAEGYKAFAKADKVPDNWTWDLYRFHPEKDESYMARAVSAGAIASLAAEMRQLAADAEAVARGDEGAIDFARFDCFACHHDLKVPSDRQKRGYGNAAPGRPPLKAWTAALPSVVVEHAAGLAPFKESSKNFGPKWEGVKTAALSRPFGRPKEVAEAARGLTAWCDDFMAKHQGENKPLYTPPEAARLMSMVGDAAVDTKWTADPEAAMHLTWAYLSLRGGRPAVPEAALASLGKVVPVRVRGLPYSDDNGDPRTVGETLRERLDVFARYRTADFTAAFKSVHAKP